jgi:Spherulation-specific family 4
MQTEAFYKSLAPVPDEGLTLGNPGDQAAASGWEFEVVDLLNVFEGADFSTSFTPKSWVSEHASQSAAIVYDASESKMKADCEKATEDKFGYVYITNEEDVAGDEYNPYRELPPYWAPETSRC